MSVDIRNDGAGQSLLSLFDELSKKVSKSDYLAISSNSGDSDAAERIAKHVLLKFEQEEGKTTVHFSAKRWYDNAWGAIRKIFTTPATEYDFAASFQDISVKFQHVSAEIEANRVSIQNPDDVKKLQALCTILNTLQTHFTKKHPEKTLEKINLVYEEKRSSRSPPPSREPPAIPAGGATPPVPPLRIPVESKPGPTPPPRQQLPTPPTRIDVEPKPGPTPPPRAPQEAVAKAAIDKFKEEIHTLKHEIRDAEQHIDQRIFQPLDEKLQALKMHGKELIKQADEAKKLPAEWEKWQSSTDALMKGLQALAEQVNTMKVENLGKCQEMKQFGEEISALRSQVKTIPKHVRGESVKPLLASLMQANAEMQTLQSEYGDGKKTWDDFQHFKAAHSDMIGQAKVQVEANKKWIDHATNIYNLTEKYVQSTSTKQGTALSRIERDKNACRAGEAEVRQFLELLDGQITEENLQQTTELAKVVVSLAQEREQKLLEDHSKYIHQGFASVDPAALRDNLEARRTAMRDDDEIDKKVPVARPNLEPKKEEKRAEKPQFTRASEIEFDDLRNEALEALKISLPKSVEEAREWSNNFANQEKGRVEKFESIYAKVEAKRAERRAMLGQLGEIYNRAEKSIPEQIQTMRDTIQQVQAQVSKEVSDRGNKFPPRMDDQTLSDLQQYIKTATQLLKEFEGRFRDLKPTDAGINTATQLDEWSKGAEASLNQKLTDLQKTVSDAATFLGKVDVKAVAGYRNKEQFAAAEKPAREFIDHAKETLVRARREAYEAHKSSIESMTVQIPILAEMKIQMREESVLGRYPFLQANLQEIVQGIEQPASKPQPASGFVAARKARLEGAVQKATIEEQLAIFDGASSKLIALEKDIDDFLSSEKISAQEEQSVREGISTLKTREFATDAPRALALIQGKIKEKYPALAAGAEAFSEVRVESVESDESSEESVEEDEDEEEVIGALDAFMTNLDENLSFTYSKASKESFQADIKHAIESSEFLRKEVFPTLQQALDVDQLQSDLKKLDEPFAQSSRSMPSHVALLLQKIMMNEGQNFERQKSCVTFAELQSVLNSIQATSNEHKAIVEQLQMMLKTPSKMIASEQAQKVSDLYTKYESIIDPKLLLQFCRALVGKTSVQALDTECKKLMPTIEGQQQKFVEVQRQINGLKGRYFAWDRANDFETFLSQMNEYMKVQHTPETCSAMKKACATLLDNATTDLKEKASDIGDEVEDVKELSRQLQMLQTILNEEAALLS